MTAGDPQNPESTPAQPSPGEAAGHPVPPADELRPDLLPGAGGDPAPPLPRTRRLWWWVRHILQIAVPLVIIWLIWEQLSELSFAEIRALLTSASLVNILLAVATAIIAVLMTGFYDVLAFPPTPRQWGTRRWGLGALFFSWTNFVALGPVGVPFLRLHWYGKAGMETAEVIRGVGRLYIGMATGLAAWAIAAVLPLGPGVGTLERAGVAIALAPMLSVTVYWLRTHFRSRDRAPTPMRTMFLLGLVGGIDWGAVLLSFVLAGRAVGMLISVHEMMRILFIGHIVGLASMVPGGLGTADAVWFGKLSRLAASPHIAAAHVLLFRIVFYMIPWLLSLVVIAVAVATHRLVRNGQTTEEVTK